MKLKLSNAYARDLRILTTTKK